MQRNSDLRFENSAHLGCNDAGWNCDLCGLGDIAHFADWVCRKDERGHASWITTSTQTTVARNARISGFDTRLAPIRYSYGRSATRVVYFCTFMIDFRSGDAISVTTVLAHGKQSRTHWREVSWLPVKPGFLLNCRKGFEHLQKLYSSWKGTQYRLEISLSKLDDAAWDFTAC